MAKARVHTVEGKSDKADKRVPIEERVAAMLVKSAYRDIRDGFGGRNPGDLGDQAVAGALGMLIQTEGRMGPMVLETHYGSTLIHAQTIRRSWENREEEFTDSHEARVLTRFGCELAIRELAYVRYGRSYLAEMAYLLATTRSALERRRDDAASWLDGILSRALDGLRQRMGPALDELRKSEEAGRAKLDSRRKRA